MATLADSLRVLVADDQPDVLHALRLLLKGAGHRAETVDTPGALLDAARTGPYDVILMDMNYGRDTTSGAEGLEVIRSLRTAQNQTPIIVMTAWGTLELAVEAMRIGASDFVQKPWDNHRLLASIVEQAGRGRAALRAREEIEIARNIQRKLLPSGSHCVRGLDCAGRCVPAREIGGDYFDFLDFDSGGLGIVVADVSGKGVGAALLMANLQALFRTHSDIHTINRLFREATPLEQYATVFYAQWNPSGRELRYVNCGHPAALLARAGGGVEELASTATVLGVFELWECEERSVRLHPGDRLLVCSDGVLESDSATHDAILAALAAPTAGETVERAIALAGDFDDATVVSLAVR